ncbi:MAG: trypsin-like peptidase domain-containing protein [Planctomycetaceae bacterium]|nr:trypsin-like peptidase domain-containing protein [Planctomycetaceae bacterium]
MGRHFARIAHLVTPSLVHIQSQRAGRNGGTVEETGSGVLMRIPGSDEVFAVTNQHVVSGAKLNDVSIKLFDGRVVRPYDKLEDLDTDVAVLKVREKGLQAAAWGDSDALDIGHLVLAMGSPFGLSKSITSGIISAKGRRSLKLGSSRDVLNQDFLQTDAAINPGNSGGPLIDMSGRVVGINTAIASSSGGNEGIGFSIPSNLVQQVVRQLMSSGRVQRSYLGVVLDEDFNAEKARKYALDRSRGARVVQVLPSSPAASAGLRPDDIVLSFDGLDIEDESHLIHLVSLTEVNRTVRLQILRAGKRETISVRLTDRTQLDKQSSAPPEQRMIDPELPTQNVGLTLHQVDADLAPQVGLAESTQGLLVMSLAEPAGANRELRLYDCITEVARTPVTSVDEFSAILSQQSNHGPLLLKIRRVEDGRTVERLILWQPQDARSSP